VGLLTELDAFYLDHRQCGELEAGVEGPVVWNRVPVRGKNGAAGGRGRRTRSTIEPLYRPGMSRPAKLHRTCGCKSRLSKRRCAQ
jgi:hypothetical protein